MARSGHRNGEHRQRLEGLRYLDSLLSEEDRARIAREVKESAARRLAQVKDGRA